MKEPIKKMEAVLSTAEHDLRKVIADSAGVGDYEAVDLARNMASRIREMLSLLSRRTPKTENESLSGGEGKVSARTGSGQSGSPRLRKVGPYPRFVIRKGVLWKYGWSKKEKKEYIHKAPREAFDQSVQAINKLVQNAVAPFTADQITQQITDSDKAIPAYQIYVALAFLRANGLIHRDGRDGYSAVQEFSSKAQALWHE